jgi:hypothetical protein
MGESLNEFDSEDNIFFYVDIHIYMYLYFIYLFSLKYSYTYIIDNLLIALISSFSNLISQNQQFFGH